ncbi:MAG: hypothetical protein Kow00105_16560 [Phycisphaeraceae bacterium]
MNLKHVQSGQPMRIPASTYNKMLDATRAHYEHQANVASSKPATTGANTTGIVYVKNDSGADQDRFAVLGIDTPIILPGDSESGGHEEEFKRQVALSCVVPVVPTHTGRFVILTEPLADGAIGRAYVDGVCVVRLRVPNNLNTGTQADVVDNDSTVLELKAGAAAQVIWREEVTTSPGECWAIVRLGPATRDGYWARIYGSADQSGNIWLYGFDEVTYDGTEWTVVPGGRYGDSLDPTTHAINTAEAGNAPTGVQGNGVDVDILNPGLTIQPAPDNVVVWVRDEPVEGGTPPVRPTFFYLNGVDGSCI